ncbi:unnamed protein product [Pneumocystis jirovecii]|uniref:Vacuolar protein sorting-associated protein 33A n=2 Tax=Pneumocystis jirovecii TaxID=42068 RepID=L0PBM9_PNEJI|nr:tethering complex ATP-binding subunit VPS33 [Pneumocystis jirovecii RU7]KTW31803.1 hypothetical protein T551_01064 [Pneumocystis jirovecii RU7]CCJ29484.1 unnamed protein product [Pneumocystis jirovecii]
MLEKRIDIEKIKKDNIKAFLSALDSVCGKKTLILDRYLSGPIGLLAKFSVLQEHGVDKVFWLSKEVPSSIFPKLYICRPTIANMYLVSAQVRSERDLKTFNSTLYLVSRRTSTCDKILEEEGVIGDLVIGSFPLWMIPFEEDLISLELKDSFKEIYMEGNVAAIYHSAHVLMEIQATYGLFPQILGKGDKAKQLKDLLFRLRQEYSLEHPSNACIHNISAIIDSLIIIDRELDLITPLMTQLTYEGLIDEIYGIKSSYTEVSSSLISNLNIQNNTQTLASSNLVDQDFQKKKVLLNSSDKIFNALRDNNFSTIGTRLNKIAKQLFDDYEERYQAKTVSQIRDFVSKLGNLQLDHKLLKFHIALTEDIMNITSSETFLKVLEIQQNLISNINNSRNSLEELLSKNIPIATVLRLICLESVIFGGIQSKDLENLKRELIHAYGYKCIVAFPILERTGLLCPRTSNSYKTYNSINKAFRLIVSDINEQNPDDISYVYSGYAPLSIRIVQCVIQKYLLKSNFKQKNPLSSWEGFEDSLKMLKGQLFNETQEEDSQIVGVKKLPRTQEKKTTIVFFLGGCTFTEIAALRFIAKQEKDSREIIIITTSIINGNIIVESALPIMS